MKVGKANMEVEVNFDMLISISLRNRLVESRYHSILNFLEEVLYHFWCEQVRNTSPCYERTTHVCMDSCSQQEFEKCFFRTYGGLNRCGPH